MDNQGFLDFVISESERMQFHMTNAHPLTEHEIAAALDLEAKYNLALEQLPPETASIIKEYEKHLSNKAVEEGISFFKKGISDGLRLYRTLQNL